MSTFSYLSDEEYETPMSSYAMFTYALPLHQMTIIEPCIMVWTHTLGWLI